MKKHVFVATPTYDGKVVKEFHNSMVGVQRLCWERGVSISERQLPGYPPDEARSLLLGWFRATKATDLFYVDADCGFDPEGFMRVLMSPKDFVGGAMRLKSDEEVFPAYTICSPDGWPWVDVSDGYILSGGLGGFFKISRKAVDAMCEFYSMLRYTAPDGTDCYDLFRREPRPGLTPYGEDLSFCRRYLKIDGQIWIDPKIDFVHVGWQSWEGNFHEALRKRPGGECSSIRDVKDPFASFVSESGNKKTGHIPESGPPQPESDLDRAIRQIRNMAKLDTPRNDQLDGEEIAERLRKSLNLISGEVSRWAEPEQQNAVPIDDDTERIVEAARQKHRDETKRIVAELNEKMAMQDDSYGW